jgi:hypothetical protein
MVLTGVKSRRLFTPVISDVTPDKSLVRDVMFIDILNHFHFSSPFHIVVLLRSPMDLWDRDETLKK